MCSNINVAQRHMTIVTNIGGVYYVQNIYAMVRLVTVLIDMKPVLFMKNRQATGLNKRLGRSLGCTLRWTP
jgi:hypothetical protein